MYVYVCVRPVRTAYETEALGMVVYRGMHVLHVHAQMSAGSVQLSSMVQGRGSNVHHAQHRALGGAAMTFAFG